MLRWFGVLILFFSCALFGFYKASILRLRQKRLSSVCLFIGTAADRIRAGEEMSSIISGVGQKAGFYADGYNICIKKDNLKGSDIKLLNDFINGLGMGDTESQLKRCETYSELFKRELADAEKETKEKANIYGKLGIFAGLLVGVVLI